MVRVALGQMAATRDKRENLAKVARMAAEAARAGAELAVFPEGAMVDFGGPGESLAPVAEGLDGTFVSGLEEIAKRDRIAIACGMFEPADKDRVYNTVVAIDRSGRLVGGYRKLHLFDAFGMKESDKIAPGPGDLLGFRVGDVSFGVMTCYDVRFPELARRLVDGGAQAIVLPAAWVFGPLKESHWEVLARARAIENTVYVLAAGQVDGLYTGSSLLIDPMGVVRGRAGEGEELVVGDVRPERVAEVRAKLPSLEHRRFAISSRDGAPVRAATAIER